MKFILVISCYNNIFFVTVIILIAVRICKKSTQHRYLNVIILFIQQLKFIVWRPNKSNNAVNERRCYLIESH